MNQNTLLRKLSSRNSTLTILSLTLTATAAGALDNRVAAQARFETQPIFAPTYIAIVLISTLSLKQLRNTGKN